MQIRLHSLAMALGLSTLLGACGGGSGTSTGTTPVPPEPPRPSAGLFLLAGQIGSEGNLDGNGSEARFSSELDIAVDQAGNLYVTDSGNYTIRKITPAGMVSTLAGQSGSAGASDGDAASARFTRLRGITVAANGTVYVADDSAIRLISASGNTSTLAGAIGKSDYLDGTGSQALLQHPSALALDASGNLYVGDDFSRNIRRISSAGVVSTFAGLPGGSCIYVQHQESCSTQDGAGTQALFIRPLGLAFDSLGNLMAADQGALRKISPAGLVSTPALPGTTLSRLTALSRDASDNLYVLDGQPGQNILRIGPAGVVTSLLAASPEQPAGYGGLAAYGQGTLYLAAHNGTIQSLTPDGKLSTLAGSPAVTGTVDGKAAAARFNLSQPLVSAAALDAAGNLYVADQNNYTIRKISADGDVTTLAGKGGEQGYTDGAGSAARFMSIKALVADASGNLYVADSSLVRKITPSGNVSTLAGTPFKFSDTDGVGMAASFSTINGISLDSAGNLIVTTPTAVRKIAPDLRVSTLAGLATSNLNDLNTGSADGSASQARFNQPRGVVADRAGNIYLADSNNHTIRKVTPGGSVGTLAGVAGQSGAADGVGSAARFRMPIGLSIDGDGNLFVTDTGNHTLRQISPDGRVSTVAGQAGKVGVRLGSLPGSLATPSAIAAGAKGVLYISSANGILKIQL